MKNQVDNPGFRKELVEAVARLSSDWLDVIDKSERRRARAVKTVAGKLKNRPSSASEQRVPPGKLPPAIGRHFQDIQAIASELEAAGFAEDAERLDGKLSPLYKLSKTRGVTLRRRIFVEMKVARSVLDFTERVLQQRSAGPAASSGGKTTKLAQALGVLATNPDWTDTKIAKKVGCRRDYLGKERRWKAARAAQKSHRDDLRRGTRDVRTGNVDVVSQDNAAEDMKL